MNRLRLLALTLLLAVSIPSPIYPQAYGGSQCTYHCSQIYPNWWDPRSVGCQAYCTWYCGQWEHVQEVFCLEIQVWYG